VVIAAASAQKPKRPAWAAGLDPAIRQIDARDYRNPGQFDGPVLVVGCGNSGAEIARDLAGSHPVLLSGNSPGELPVPYDSWFAGRVLMPFLFKILFHRILTTSTPMGRRVLPHAIAHSHPLIRVRRRHLAAAGVTLLPKMSGTQGGKPLFEDGTTRDVPNIVWCTGYSCGLDWVKLPVFDDNARPRQVRGSVTGQPGLHLVGLHFQRAESSIMIHGVGTDARIVTAEVARRLARGPVAA
jgi:putative flavoprotein involved in K+ transport